MRADRIVAAIGLSVASCRFGDWHQTEPPPRGRRGARSTGNGPRDHRPLLRLPAPETGRLLRRHPGHAHRRSPLRRNGAARWGGGGRGAAPGRHRLAAGGGAGHAPGARPHVEHPIRSPKRGHGGHRRDGNRWQDDHDDHDPPDAAERRPACRLDEHGRHPFGRRRRSKRLAPNHAGGARGAGAVGSHALALQRVLGVEYDLAVFTNIAHEHLDFHKTIEAYREAKAQLIDLTAGSARKGIEKTAVLNRDDPSYAYLVERPIARRITYGLQLDADLKAERVEATPEGLRVQATTPLGPLALRLKLSGRWNAANALAAVAAGVAIGLTLDEVRQGLESYSGVSGRMERVDLGQPFSVIIDYAHTPQSLEKVLRELRPITRGKLIAVFGSAGDRDREKRPWMGEIAARLSDYAVFTNEDPREEDAMTILSDIAAGAEEVGWTEGEQYARIEDRRQGIAHAVRRAGPGDTVLLAGKGHERSIL